MLSPAIGELLRLLIASRILQPIAFVFVAAFYGSSAIVMRELKIRWNKNFRSLLLPGAGLNCLAIAAGGLSSGSSWLFCMSSIPMQGMSLVGIVAIVGIFVLKRRIKAEG